MGEARLFCAMSHKEGSFVAVAEALMSGTPVAMFHNAMIGTKAHINAQTGFLIEPGLPLGPQLASMLERSRGLDPADWARANISVENNVLVFNRLMQQHSACTGAAWTRDISPFHCRNFSFVYMNEADRDSSASEYELREHSFGLRLVEFRANSAGAVVS